MSTEGQGEDGHLPFAQELAQLEAFDPEEVRGRSRLGDLAFERAPTELTEIIAFLRDLREEDWGRLDPSLQAQIASTAQAAASCVAEMMGLTSSAEDAHAQKAGIEARLTETFTSLRSIWSAYAQTARIRRELTKQSHELDPEERLHVQNELVAVEERLRSVQAQLDATESVVAAAREAAGISAGSDLSEFYRDRAADEVKRWHSWGWGLVLALVVAIAGGLVTVLETHPDKNATNAEIASSLAVDLLVVGLLLYAVRIAAVQFRSHRHLWLVNLSKEAALSTFSRLIAVPGEAEVRGQVALVVAKQVLSVEDTGLTDSSGDNVTLIEQVLAPAVSRISP